MGYSPSVVVSGPDRVLKFIRHTTRDGGATQFFSVALVIGALLLGGAASAQTGTFMAFGPQNYTRGTGDPINITNNISVLNPNTQYILKLKVFNHGLQDTPTGLVSGGFVVRNGVQVVGPSNFNQNVSEIDVPITLQQANTLSVKVRGKPGGLLTIEVISVNNGPPTLKATVSPAPNATNCCGKRFVED